MWLGKDVVSSVARRECGRRRKVVVVVVVVRTVTWVGAWWLSRPLGTCVHDVYVLAATAWVAAAVEEEMETAAVVLAVLGVAEGCWRT